MHFSVPTTIYFGDNAKDALKQLKAPFVVADAFFKDSPALSGILTNFKQHTLFCDFTPDPTLHSVAKGVAAFKNSKAESILAVGGGSAIDTAKAILYFSETKVPLAVIPTTSGTGSEVTAFSVVTNTETHTKYPLIADCMLPQIAILDLDFIKTLPPKIAADTGADALCHALEAYVAKNRNPFSDALAEKAVVLLMRHLASAVAGDERAKEQVHFASTMAGIAFNSAGLGICHGLAHALGARFKIPHGRANALLICPVIAKNAQDAETEKRYATLSRLLGNEGGTAMLTRHLIKDMKCLFRKIGIPEHLGIPHADFEAQKADTVKAALSDACTGSNPVSVTEQDLLTIYKEVL